MTFLQPHKHTSIINAVLVVLAVALVGEVFGMVALYNMTVNLNQSVASAKTKLDSVGAETTNLNNIIIASLSSDQAAAVASQDGLVQDSRPQYVMITSPWPTALR